MKIKGKIFQIIKWEDKDNYFYRTDFGTVPRDLLHLSPAQKEGTTLNMILATCPFSALYWILCKKLGFDKPIYSYNNMPFHLWMYKDGRGEQGLPVWVERPNNYKEGDYVEIEINVSEPKVVL